LANVVAGLAAGDKAIRDIALLTEAACRISSLLELSDLKILVMACQLEK
jgi:hypothetical protein